MNNAKTTTQASTDIARWQLYLCCLLLVACTIPWRRGTYFSGALDPVVAAKGLLGGAGLAMAFLLSRRSTRHTVVGARTLTLARVPQRLEHVLPLYVHAVDVIQEPVIGLADDRQRPQI